jgi:ribonuclease J
VKDRKFNYHYVHSSGHADLPTLTKMVNGLNPKKLIPIHTFKKEEYKQKFNKPTIELKDGELLQC